MFEGFEKVIKGKFAPVEIINNQIKVRPIHILDMSNLIGCNVVVGGVRRTAEIFLGDPDDEEIANAKKNITPDLYHRFMSNNSILFDEQPTREELHKIFTSIRINGEPGFVNMKTAKKRRPNAKGLNPCGEVLLDTYEVCNLTTVNVMQFVEEVKQFTEEDEETNCWINYKIDYQGLMEAQALSARAGIRMTCLDLELPHWDKTMKRDRLIACSLTGWKDAMGLLGYTTEQENNLKEFLADVAFNEAIRYAHILRIPMPLLTTTIKPEGTLSQVAGGVSSGLHASYAPYYIRRIRINATDALVGIVKELGWTVTADTGQDKDNPRVVVVDFPVKSSAIRTRKEETIEEQFETYFDFQKYYTAHNSSITIYVKDDEWDKAEQILWDNWDDFIGVTFISYDGGNYELAPYEEITEEQYEERKSKMKPFDHDLLVKYESEEAVTIEENMEGCEGGSCPIR